MTRPVRVLVVDDSVVVRGMITRLLEPEPDIQVVGSADNGKTALLALERHPVDIVLLDVDMPEMDGLTALPRILAENPGVRVIMASALTTRGAETTIRALSLGASDYIAKPSAKISGRELDSIAQELKSKVRVLGGGSAAAPEPPSAVRRRPRAERPTKRPRVLLIGASTGGPTALTRLFELIGAGLPVPILVVQHMPAVFTRKLAERLDVDTAIPTREAHDGQLLEPGTASIAPGDYHMTVKRQTQGEVIRLDREPPVHFCRPAVDPLFESAARCFGDEALAIVLTGMGDDGKTGAEALVRAGSRVLVQDRESSVVWGMPGSIAKSGLAAAVLAVEELAAEVRRAVAR